ncbi:MAG: NAD(P)H-dependent oxidoreductase [Plesiomonas shigelloides]
MSNSSSCSRPEPAANSVLVLYAHPASHHSEIIAPMYRIACDTPGVTCIDLYALYPTFNINIQAEQQRLMAHQTVIFLFPLYWYSTPSMLKEWQDLVLEYGFAYGLNADKGIHGDKLKGKTLLCALSAGGTEHAYQPGGANRHLLRALLSPLEQTAQLIGMVFLPPFALFGARSAVDKGRLPEHLARWQRLLTTLVAGVLPDEEYRQRPLLNGWEVLS